MKPRKEHSAAAVVSGCQETCGRSLEPAVMRQAETWDKKQRCYRTFAPLNWRISRLEAS